MIVNENIKLIRETSNFTQAQFANLMRVPLSSLKNYENTDVMPKVDLLNNLSTMLRIPVNDLINTKLTANDINVERLKMDQTVRTEQDRGDFWHGIADKKAYSLEELQQKHAELQSEYIAQLRRFDEVQTGYRDVLKDVNEQRSADMKMVVSMIGEISKRLDRLEGQFDETKKGLHSMIIQIEGEFRKRLDGIDNEFFDSTKEFTEGLKQIEFYLDQRDPKFFGRPNE